MLRKAYLEITNDCNLACTFCHGTARKTHYMTRDEFEKAASELRRHTEYLYFHLMGEPLLHPLMGDFLNIADSMGFKAILTTNGTLLPEKKELLLSARALHKVNISLHSYEANHMGISLDTYLNGCFSFCEEASNKGVISVMRLWNVGTEDSRNATLLEKMKSFFGDDWSVCRNGYKIGEKIFLEWGERFEWPDEAAEAYSESHSCYGLRDQVGVLCDGRVVPCCLDADGVITLGNIFEDSLENILASKRAVALKRSFEERKIKEPLCQHCDFAMKRVK